MRIDRLMPHCDFYERHSTLVRATPERTYDAILAADLTASPLAKFLMLLRGMGWRRKRRATAFADGFAVAAQDRPSEIVIGLEGPFWKPTCKVRGVDAEGFRVPVPHDTARGAMNFFVEREGDATRVTTETRVLCSDDARPKFRLYWMLIRPFSGIIRRMMLRAIRQEAEA
jgi:hypothetical protein